MNPLLFSVMSVCESQQRPADDEEHRDAQRITEDNLRHAAREQRCDALAVEQVEPERIEHEMHRRVHEEERQRHVPECQRPPVKGGAVDCPHEQRREREAREERARTEEAHADEIRSPPRPRERPVERERQEAEAKARRVSARQRHT